MSYEHTKPLTSYMYMYNYHCYCHRSQTNEEEEERGPDLDVKLYAAQ